MTAQGRQPSPVQFHHPIVRGEVFVLSLLEDGRYPRYRAKARPQGFQVNFSSLALLLHVLRSHSGICAMRFVRITCWRHQSARPEKSALGG